MRHLSRNIYTTHTPENGDLYYFRVKHHNKGVFISKEMAEEARMDYDFDKASWNAYTLDNIRQLPDDVEVHSKIKVHLPTGRWYVELKYKDDIIVSDLFSTKKEVLEIQEYLDKNKWSIKALNQQKQQKSTCTRRFAGILPIKNGNKKGYLVVDSSKKEYGVFDSLTEAETRRNMLRSRGVQI